MTGAERWLARLLKSPEVGLYWYGSTKRNWSVRVPHGLPEHLVYFMVAGSCEGEAGDQRIELSPGSLMWLKPHVRLDLRASTPRPVTLYRFRLLPVAGEEPPLGPVVVVRDAWELRPPFDTLINELGLALPLREHRIRASMLLLFTAILRLAERQRNADAGGAHPLDAQQRALLERHVDGCIAQRVRPEELAALLSLSPEYFTRRFRQTFGVPPKVWLVRRRIHHAAARLDEGQESIVQVAASLGYPDVFLFSRQFKSVMGVSPRAYRAR
jgi:AraC-like DNA-binding protein